jgi:hypothetical protein
VRPTRSSSVSKQCTTSQSLPSLSPRRRAIDLMRRLRLFAYMQWRGARLERLPRISERSQSILRAKRGLARSKPPQRCRIWSLGGNEQYHSRGSWSFSIFFHKGKRWNCTGASSYNYKEVFRTRVTIRTPRSHLSAVIRTPLGDSHLRSRTSELQATELLTSCAMAMPKLTTDNQNCLTTDNQNCLKARNWGLNQWDWSNQSV